MKPTMMPTTRLEQQLMIVVIWFAVSWNISVVSVASRVVSTPVMFFGSSNHAASWRSIALKLS